MRIGRVWSFGGLACALIAAVALVGCGEDAAPKRTFTLGVVTNNPNGLKNIVGFQQEMGRLGYIEGRNVIYVDAKRHLKGKDLDATLSGFVHDKVDLIFTAGTPTGVAAFRMTKGSDIPVVFGVIADPIRAGVMTDLTEPGGNMTGVKLSQNQALRLELFLQIAPNIKKMAILYNPNDSAATSSVAQIKGIISDTQTELLLIKCPDNDAVTASLKTLDERADSVFLVPDSLVNKHIKDIVKVAIKLKIPLFGPSGAQLRQGALMSYGISHHDVGAQAARIADQVLKGSNAGKVPVETARSYLGINLKTANAIGVSVADQIIRQSEEIIRPEG